MDPYGEGVPGAGGPDTHSPNALNAKQSFSADGTLTEQPWITRKHQAFRPVDDAAFFYGLHVLVGRERRRPRRLGTPTSPSASE